MLKPWEETAEYLIKVFKHHIKQCTLAEAPLFSEEYFPKAARVAELDGPAKDYLAYLIGWGKGESPDLRFTSGLLYSTNHFGHRSRKGELRRRDGRSRFSDKVVPGAGFGWRAMTPNCKQQLLVYSNTIRIMRWEELS